MNAIVAVDNRWAIGNKGGLLVRIPMDQKFFREVTIGKVVVLGRKTLSTFPNGLPLPGRTNIILSRNQNLQVKGATVVHSREELFEELKKYNSEDIYVIGGSMVYNLLIPYCSLVHVTKIIVMRQILIFRIWMKWRNGKLPEKVMKIHILIWNLLFTGMRINIRCH